MDEFEYAMGGSPETNPFSLSDYSIGTIILFILLIIVVILNIISFIRLYKKMGYSGWKAIIPVYNFMVLAEMGNMKSAMGLLFLVPIVNIIFLFKAYKAIANKMNLSSAYPILLTFLPFIFIPFVAFNKNIVCQAEYMHNEDKIESNDIYKATSLDDLMGQQTINNEMQNNMNPGMMGNNGVMNPNPQNNMNVMNNGFQNNMNQGMMNNNGVMNPNPQNNMNVMNNGFQNNINQGMMNNNGVINPNPQNNMNAMNNGVQNNMNQGMMDNNGVMNPNPQNNMNAMNNGFQNNMNQGTANNSNGVFDPNNFGNN